MAVRYFTWDGSTYGVTIAHDLTLSNGSRTAARTSTGTAPRAGRSVETIAVNEDVTVFVTLDLCSNLPAGNTGIGLVNGSFTPTDGTTVGQNANSCAYYTDGTVFRGGSNVSPISGAAVTAPAVGNTIGLQITRSSGTNRVAFSKDGGATWSGDYAITVLGDSNILYLAFNTYYLNDQWTATAAGGGGGGGGGPPKGGLGLLGAGA